jgi:hypothetical protein
MTASALDIRGWFEEGVRQGVRYLIVGLDPFDHDNFPCYCKDEQAAATKIAELIDSGNGFDEVYDLQMDKAKQMAERRARNLPGLDDIVSRTMKTRRHGMWSGR